MTLEMTLDRQFASPRNVNVALLAGIFTILLGTPSCVHAQS